MRVAFFAITILALACTGCSDRARAKAEEEAARDARAEAARADQAKAEADLARIKTETELAKTKADLAKAEAKADLAKTKTVKHETPVKSELTAPRLLAPPDGSVFDKFPRKITLRWAPVAGAAMYKVEVEYEDPFEKKWSSFGVKEMGGTEYQFDFVGAQPGRWRVWAVDDKDQEGPKSGWCSFRYTR